MGKWIIFAFLGLGIATAVWLDLGRWSTFALGIVVCAPAIRLTDDWGRVARVRRYDSDTLTFSFKRLEYAREFAGLNHLQCK